jgi:hypothetical protein
VSGKVEDFVAGCPQAIAQGFALEVSVEEFRSRIDSSRICCILKDDRIEFCGDVGEGIEPGNSIRQSGG